MGLGAEEVVVPDAEQRHNDRDVLLERASCGSTRRPRARRSAIPRSDPCRCRWRWRGRWPTRANSARRPNPRTRTCCPDRCRTRPRPSALVDRATKCLATALSSPAAARNQRRAVWALVMVSWVVKVLEATRKSVVSGSNPLERLGDVGAVHVGDEVHAQVRACRRASAPCVTILGPRSEPPMPMLTTSVMRLAGVAAPLAAAHAFAEEAHLAPAPG